MPADYTTVIERWCDAECGWRADRVRLDGRDVGDRCTSVGFVGETPRAVILVDEAMSRRMGAVCHERLDGAVAVEGLRRPPPAESCTMKTP